jgi:hypothetical protein
MLKCRNALPGDFTMVLSRGLSAAALLLGLAAAAVPAMAESRPVVVELFTSQGCSSCPPADALLGELSRRAGVAALGFHISYWDRLGWRDPLSSPAATDRQNSYARHLTGGQVYTPQIVVDGTADVVGSDREAVLDSVRQAGRAAAPAIVPVIIAADRRSVAVGDGNGSGEVVLVRFAKHRTTHVGAGENSGRVADDFNGVETLTGLGTWDGGSRTFTIEPPGTGQGLAVLVQAPEGQMLGAAVALDPG